MRAVLALSLACLTAAAQHPVFMADQAHVETVWVDGGRVADDYPMGLVMALNLRNMDTLRAEVDDRANPRSANYAKWLTRDQVRKLTAPAPEAVESVVRFCKNSLGGSAEVTFLNDFVNCVAPAAKVADAFGADIRTFTHKDSRRGVVRAHPGRKISWPAGYEDAAAAVSVIEGLADFFDYPSDRKASKKARHAKFMQKASEDMPDLVIAPPRGSEERPVVEIETRMDCTSGTFSIFANGRRLDEWMVLSITQATGPGMTTKVIMSGPWTPYQRMNRITVEGVCGDQRRVAIYDLPFAAPSPWGTPRLVADYYGVPINRYSFDSRGATQAVAEFEKQYFSFEDLAQFRQLHGLPATPINVVGPNDETAPGGEAELDIQWITAMAPTANTTFWSVGGPGPAHGSAYVLTWAMQMLADSAPPLVTSISYGDTEGGFFRKFGDYKYIHRMEDSMAQMASLGLTVVVSSGDAGATNVGEPNNDISGADPDCSIMRPSYPSNSIYAVGVSGTFFTRYATNACSASAQNSVEVGPCGEVGEAPTSLRQGSFWTTGGGFSGIIPRPQWQADVVDAYVAASKGNSMWPTASQFNVSGRAYPDVSAIGYNLECVVSKQVVPIGGTSASSPIIAGIFTQINNLRLKAGLGPMGPPHQVLYADRKLVRGIHRDIVVGDNRDGDHQFTGSKYPALCPNGFPSALGWDAVTGLGTPVWDLWLPAFTQPSKDLA